MKGGVFGIYINYSPPSCCPRRSFLRSSKVGSSDKAASKQLIAMGVTDRNILLFLAQIEEQIDYIVQARGGRLHQKACHVSISFRRGCGAAISLEKRASLCLFCVPSHTYRNHGCVYVCICVQSSAGWSGEQPQNARCGSRASSRREWLNSNSRQPSQRSR